MDRPLGDPEIAIEILRQENAALRSRLSRLERVREAAKELRKILKRNTNGDWELDQWIFKETGKQVESIQDVVVGQLDQALQEAGEG